MKRVALILLSVLMAVAVRAADISLELRDSSKGPGERSRSRLRTLSNEVVGTAVEIPSTWRVHEDPVLFNTYGFALFDPEGPKVGGHERSPVARIALAYQIRPEQVEALIADLLQKNSALPVRRVEVAVGGGLKGLGVTGLPGTDPYTLLYVADGDRVYRIGLWTASAESMQPGFLESGLDARALNLLASLRFEEPSRSVESLRLTPVGEAMYARPPAEQMALNAQAHAERTNELAGLAGEAPIGETEVAAARLTPVNNAACEFAQPWSLNWQTVWDSSNRFYTNYTTTYSGTYYNLRPNQYGWSAMSGNYGSWWGQNFHIRKCNTGMINQYYANDWPVHFNGNVYSATNGKVEWAGWDYYDSEGYMTLGNYVVVRNGSYRAVMAHLTSIAPGITWGASVGLNTIIGYAGRTGGPWDEHVHSRIAYGESLTYNGQPYGGSIVWPTYIRCVSCPANDPGDARGNGDGQYDYYYNGIKYYTRFYHGRWMRG